MRDAFDVRRTQEDMESFSMAFIPAFLLVCAGSVIGLSLGLVVGPIFATSSSVWSRLVFVVLALTLGVPMLAGVSALLTLALLRIFRVHIGQAGIRCFDFWGVYRFVAWDQAEPLGVFNFFGAKYLRLRAKDSKRVVWVPVQLRGGRRFGELARSFESTPGHVSEYFPQTPSDQEDWPDSDEGFVG